MDTLKHLDKYIPQEILDKLHQEAFSETCSKMNEFNNQSNAIYKLKDEDKQYIRWVINSAPGTGKTTALKTLCKRIGNNRFDVDLRKHSFLLVFKTVKNMMDVYNKISEYAFMRSIPHLIQYVDSGNVEDVMESLVDFQIVCITHHRLRDLALGYGNWLNYSMYKNERKKVYSKRSIIIDEMPEFFNEQIFDLAAENNTIQFYDTLTDNTSGINEEDIIFCRNLIIELIALELKTNEQTSTRKLLNPYISKDDAKKLTKILSSLSTENVDTETLRRFNWFKKLLKYDNVGCIERHRNKNVILCSDFIDYSWMGNILILDGSSHITKMFYDHAKFQIQEMKNYHNYKKRLKIYWGKLNTSYNSRSQKDKGVQEAISLDIQSIRKIKKLNLLPLMNKIDIPIYMKNGTITVEQSHYFLDNYIDENMAINLLNTTGINDLSGYNALALLNLPIREPSYYRLKLIGLVSPTKANIELDKNNKEKWFVDDKLNEILKVLMLADFYQIIHRSNLRFINSTDNTYIFLYHSREEWTEQIRKVFKLPKSSVKIKDIKNGNMNGFNNSCIKWALKSKETLEKYSDGWNRTIISPQQVSKSFKKFITDHWKNESKRNIIINVFQEHGLKIYVNKNDERKITFS